MFGYNAQLKRCAIDGAKTLRVQRWSATTGVKLAAKITCQIGIFAKYHIKLTFSGFDILENLMLGRFK